MGYKDEKTIMKRGITSLGMILSFFLALIIMFNISIFDSDKKISERENRGLAAFPKFTVSRLFSGEFISEFETYYSDQFPFRDMFLSVNDKMNKITTQFSSGGENDVVIISQEGTGDDFGGESLHEKEGNS